MKKILFNAIALSAVLSAVCITVSCASAPSAAPKKGQTSQMVDYKDKKFGKSVPYWVTMEVRELEARKEYAESYVFKFESPRGKSLEGVRSITQNLDAPQQIAQMAAVRMKNKAAGTGTDTADAAGQAVIRAAETLGSVHISGLRREADFWTQDRYFDAAGEVTEESFTYYVIYTVPRETMDKIIKSELKKALEGVQARSAEEQDALKRAQNIFENGLSVD
ncbi:MAG: hypothetical protein P1P65_09775 [Treponema sp.]